MKGRILALLGVTASLACADILGINDVPPATDEGGAEDGAADAPAPMCDPTAPFGTPTAVPGLSPDGVGVIGLSPDELTAFICRSSPDDTALASLFTATRKSSTAKFGTEVLVPTDDRACGATTTANNLTLVWSEQDPPDGQSDPPTHLYIASRQSPSEAFNLVDGGKRIPTALGASAEGPFLSPDGTELYYTSVSGTDVRSYQASAEAGFGNGAPVPGIDGQAYGMIVSPSGLIAYFVNAGNLQVATRDSRSSPFGAATDVGVVDAGKGVSVAPVFVSDDACKFYYATPETYVPADGNYSFRTTLYVVMKTPS